MSWKLTTIIEKSQTVETINGNTASWYKITTENKKEGWVFGHYIKFANKEK